MFMLYGIALPFLSLEEKPKTIRSLQSYQTKQAEGSFYPVIKETPEGSIDWFYSID